MTNPSEGNAALGEKMLQQESSLRSCCAWFGPATGSGPAGPYELFGCCKSLPIGDMVVPKASKSVCVLAVDDSEV